MSRFEDETLDAYHCLLVAIFCEVDSVNARLLYAYGPEHPICQRFLKKKLSCHRQKISKAQAGKMMLKLKQEGFSVNEIAESFLCFPSTVNRRIKRAESESTEQHTFA